MDNDGNTCIALEIIIAPSYQPGQALEMEARLQAEFNKMACQAMAQLLSTYDTCGEPITRGGVDYTTKGRSPATYQCAGGPFTLERHVYQSASGGRTWCPLEEHGRIIAGATPHFAKVASSLYATQSGRAVLRHLETTLQRSLSLNKCPGRSCNYVLPPSDPLKQSRPTRHLAAARQRCAPIFSSQTQHRCALLYCEPRYIRRPFSILN